MRIFERWQYLLSLGVIIQFLMGFNKNHILIVHLLLLLNIAVGYFKEGMRLTQIPLWAAFFVHALIHLTTGAIFTYPLFGAGFILSVYWWI
jgi:hypothetical protein